MVAALPGKALAACPSAMAIAQVGGYPPQPLWAAEDGLAALPIGPDWLSVAPDCFMPAEPPASAAPLAPPAFANPDPAALSLGIHFSQSVPMTARRVIVEDLEWLAGLDSLQGGQQTAAYLGLPEDLTGADLVAWLLGQAVLISGDPPCLTMRTILLAERGADPAAAVELFGQCHRTNFGFWSFVESNPYRPNTLVRYYDDYAVATSGGAVPVLYIGPRFLREVESTSWNSRLRRVSVLFHEAYHVAHPDEAGHVVCSHVNLLARTTVYGRTNGPMMGGGERCDFGQYSSYYLDAILTELLLAHCDACTATDRAQVTDFAIDSYLRVQLPLAAPQRVPDEPLFRLLSIANESFLLVPPLRFFELLAVRMAEVQGETPDWFLALADLTAEVTAREEPSMVQRALFERVSPFPVDTDGALRWLAEARAAEADGYNVPLLVVTPCTALPFGCGDGWWDRIPRLENGVGLTAQFISGQAFQLGIFELPAPAGGVLELRLAGSLPGAVLHVCHIETRACITRTSGPQGSQINWPNVAAGEYGVWVDAYTLPSVAAAALTITARW